MALPICDDSKEIAEKAVKIIRNCETGVNNEIETGIVIIN